MKFSEILKPKRIILFSIIYFIYFYNYSFAHTLNLESVRREIFLYNTFNFNGFQFEEFSEVIFPKISLIITLYNQKRFILRIYFCILKQTLKEIEIIFIDDASTDNSFIVVENLMKKDKRIVYLKNKKNRGQFFSRNKGVFYARSNYVIIK